APPRAARRCRWGPGRTWGWRARCSPRGALQRDRGGVAPGRRPVGRAGGAVAEPGGRAPGGDRAAAAAGARPLAVDLLHARGAELGDDDGGQVERRGPPRGRGGGGRHPRRDAGGEVGGHLVAAAADGGAEPGGDRVGGGAAHLDE